MTVTRDEAEQAVECQTSVGPEQGRRLARTVVSLYDDRERWEQIAGKRAYTISAMEIEHAIEKRAMLSCIARMQAGFRPDYRTNAEEWVWVGPTGTGATYELMTPEQIEIMKELT